MRLDKLFLWFLGEPRFPLYVGQLRMPPGSKGVSLAYCNEWINSGFALSEDLPLATTEYRPRSRLVAGGHVAVGAIDDARPDWWGERVIRFVEKPKRSSLMEFLFYAGDDRIGALGVSISAMRYEPRTKEPLPSLEQINQIGDVVAKIAAVKPITQSEERVVVRAAGGIGGAKPKALIQIDNEQWIVKFYNGEPVDSPVVEHASMTLAAKAGIRVAQTQVLTLANSLHALAIRRFDRQGQRRIHAISAGTVLRATTPHVGQINEMGYPALALVLRRMGTTDNEENVADARELFRRMVFNILINNTDDHEKNHTILVVSPWKNGRYRLSPAYDVLPSNSRQGHQEFVCGDFTYEPTLENAMSQCMSFGLFPKEAALEIQRVIATVDLWTEHFAQCGVSSSDIEQLAQHIDGKELLSQRRLFNANNYASAPTRRKRTSPFVIA